METLSFLMILCCFILSDIIDGPIFILALVIMMLLAILFKYF